MSNLLLLTAVILIIKLIHLSFFTKEVVPFDKKVFAVYSVAKSQNDLVKSLMPHLELLAFLKKNYTPEELTIHPVYLETSAKINLMLKEAGFKTRTEFYAQSPKNWTINNINF